MRFAIYNADICLLLHSQPLSSEQQLVNYSFFTLIFILLTKMQKIVLVALALVAVAAAAPQQAEQAPPAYILKQESDVNPEGYNFEFETSDGTSRQEQGTLKQVDDVKAISVTGTYKYTAPDGLIYTVTFIADEHGFQPQEHVEQPQQ